MRTILHGHSSQTATRIPTLTNKFNGVSSQQFEQRQAEVWGTISDELNAKLAMIEQTLRESENFNKSQHQEMQRLQRQASELRELQQYMVQNNKL